MKVATVQSQLPPDFTAHYDHELGLLLIKNSHGLDKYCIDVLDNGQIVVREYLFDEDGETIAFNELIRTTIELMAINAIKWNIEKS